MNQKQIKEFFKKENITQLTKENINNPFGKREVTYRAINQNKESWVLKMNIRTFLSLKLSFLETTQLNDYTYIHKYNI